jgi:formate dehydrogenase alpha subunit
VASNEKSPVNGKALCMKGRFGWDFVYDPKRLTVPLVKKNGRFAEASWDEALDLVARRLGDVKMGHGPDALAVIGSARCTNEENYLLQRFTRAVLGTNNVGHCAGIRHAPIMAGLAASLDGGAMTNSINEIKEAGLLFLIGSNTTTSHPVIGYKVRQAVRRGAKLVIADARRVELAEEADWWLRLKPGMDIVLLNGLAHIIIAEGLQDPAFVAGHTEHFARLATTVQAYTPRYVAEVTGVPAEELYAVARLYATTAKAMIFYTPGVSGQVIGKDNVTSMVDLALLTGHLGRSGAGVNPIRGQNNVQGACDMGALPNVYPGYQRLTDPRIRSRFEAAWSVHLPDRAGFTIPEMFSGAGAGQVKAMYILGGNPVLSDPDAGIRQGLLMLDFLVVQDLFLTETAEYADVVLPAASFAETDGTYTNTERRVQRVRGAIAPLSGRTNWQIIMDLCNRMGHPVAYASPREIFADMASLTPSYAGITYDRLEEEGIQWPCPDINHPGTPFLSAQPLAREKSLFQAVHYVGPVVAMQGGICPDPAA